MSGSSGGTPSSNGRFRRMDQFPGALPRTLEDGHRPGELGRFTYKQAVALLGRWNHQGSCHWAIGRFVETASRHRPPVLTQYTQFGQLGLVSSTTTAWSP